jgi:pyrroloquinoline quinone biosynthesis protein E
MSSDQPTDPTPRRTIITAASKPALPRHIRLRHDAGRGVWMILAPERIFTPDEIAVAVLQLCDAHRTVDEIAQELSRTYDAGTGQILADIVAMLQELADKGVIIEKVAGGECEGPVPIQAPVGLLAELTHRCPLQCPYCSNPLALERVANELPTETWLDVLAQAAELGVLQLHLSGGEPTVRRDLEQIVAQAAKVGLYSNLITAGVLLTRARLEALVAHGLDHVQVSIQDTDAANADRIAHYKGGHNKKLEVAGWVRALGLPLTLNAPVHRQNIASLPAIVDLAVRLGAQRLEVAHVQYYGWALENRRALMPTRDQVLGSAEFVAAAQERLKGVLVIDFVVPDYYAKRPKPCMGGWGRGIINITPSGKALPCHAAESLPGLTFGNVRDTRLRDIWLESDAFRKFRGTEWMREPCRSCEFRERDWGGCRCQAFAFTGEADLADPACDRSLHHAAFVAAAMEEAAASAPPLVFRRPRANGVPKAP